MFLLIICLASLSLSAATEKPFYNLDEAEQLFEEFIRNYEKSYINNQEKQKRFDIFNENLKEINRLNSISSSISGINQFTDLTKDEFVRKHTGFIKPMLRDLDDCRVITDDQITTNEAPDSLDYRGFGIVTSVKDQNPCGSCWAFATTACIESQYARKHEKLIRLSEQQIMDCTDYPSGEGHCDDGGLASVAFSQLAQNHQGVALESDNPYVNKDSNCTFADPTKFSVKVSGCVRFSLSEEKLKEALYKYGPLVGTVYATNWQHYQGGVYNATECGLKETVNHQVLLVGYGRTFDVDGNYWIIKNSWGPKFGEEGYIRMSRGEGACGIVSTQYNTVVFVE